LPVADRLVVPPPVLLDDAPFGLPGGDDGGAGLEGGEEHRYGRGVDVGGVHGWLVDRTGRRL
jgi:hypothetical protein